MVSSRAKSTIFLVIGRQPKSHPRMRFSLDSQRIGGKENTNMTNPSPARKSAKAPATYCARCGTKLIRPGTVVLGIGMVGPECVKHVNAALKDLAAGPLALMVSQGEVCLTLQRTADGGLIPSHEALSQYLAWAERAGIELKHLIDPKAGVYRLSIKARSLKDYCPSIKGVQA